jgi:hypothetical protein
MNINGTQGSPYQGITQTRPYDFGTDAIERQRVSLGQAMMDADFEYGLQATKWQSFFEIRKTPTFFDIPGTDVTLSNVVSDGAAPYSNIIMYYNTTYSQPQVIGQPISIFGLSNPTKTADRAEGYFIVTSNTASTANYIAKGYVAAGTYSNIQTNLTFSRRGGIYSSGLSNIQFTNVTTDSSSNITVSTSNAHGILAGTPITLQTSNLTVTSGGSTANGTFIVTSVMSANTFNLVANTTTFTTQSNVTLSNIQLYIDPYGSTQHRPYDGGVLLSTLAPVHGSSVLRQSKKAFRYQSGKGILYSSGTLFCPNLDVASVNLIGLTATSSSNVSVSNGFTLTVSQPYLLGLQQNVVFSSGQTTFISSNVSSISGSNVTFVATGTFPGSNPSTVTQNVVSTAAFTSSDTVIPLASVAGFATGSATIGNFGSFTITAISPSGGSAVLPYTTTSSLPTATPFTITLGNYGNFTVSSISAGTSITLASLYQTVPQGTAVTYSTSNPTTGLGTLVLPVSSTTHFTPGGTLIQIGSIGYANTLSVSAGTSLTLSNLFPYASIPTSTTINVLSSNTTTAASTLLVPLSNTVGFSGGNYSVNIGSLGTATVASNTLTALVLSTYPSTYISVGTLISNGTVTGNLTSGSTSLILPMSNTTGFSGTNFPINLGQLSATSLISSNGAATVSTVNPNANLYLSSFTLNPLPAGTLVSNVSTVTGTTTSGTPTLTVPYTATSVLPSTTPFTTNIGTVSAVSASTSLTFSSYPTTPVLTGTTVTYTSNLPTTGTEQASLTFSPFPYISIPVNTSITQGAVSVLMPNSLSPIPLNIPVASTNGFIIGETVTLNPAITTLGTLTVVSNASTVLGLSYSGTTSASIPVPQYTTIYGSPVNIIGNGLITANINGNQIFSPGQIVASYLGQNMGNVTIASTTTVGGNNQVQLSYTGTFPPQGISSGTTITTLPVGSNIQIVTDISHGIPTTGATVTLRNFSTSALNGSYTITGCIDSRTVNVQSQSVLTSIVPVLGDQPRLVVTNWHGSTVRAGIYDDPNGMFWEYDGQTLSVVRRQSTFQCAGYISVSPQSQVLIGQLTPTTGSINPSSTSVALGATSVILTCTSHTLLPNMYAWITGLGYVWVIGVPDYYQVQIGFLPTTSTSLTTIAAAAITFSLPTTRFQDQLKVNDRFTIRGMTHQVTSIQGQGILTFNPPYRGTSIIDPSHTVKACKIKELRIPQSQFNRDTMDGKGASGFKVDLSRMQMIGIQYTWYGAGFVDFMMRGPDGNWLYAHRIRNNNVNDEAYMRSGNLPVRYELTVECRAAVTTMSSSLLGSSASTDIITVNDATNLFPTSGTLLIDNEFVNYSNNTGTGFTGLTRASPLVYVINDVPRTLTGQAASTHLAGTSVNLISCTATPTLTHWGSSFLTDGQFDTERGYYFNYSNTTITLQPFGSGAFPGAGSNACAFAIRLAPSVTNGLTGDIGTKELLNRAQLLLQKLEITSNTNVQTIGFLNPTGITFNPSNWQPVNIPSNGTQPSFVQYYPGNLILGVPQPGERIFSTIAQGNNQNNLDLSNLKEMSNSIIGGNQNYPDGPDSLVIFVQNLAIPGTNFGSGFSSVQVNLFWSEAQA